VRKIEMNEIKRAAILATLIKKMNLQSSWSGETHIQKSVYFLQEMLKVPTDFDYILYKHGPFSFDLRDELTLLRGKLFLELQANPYPYGPSYTPGRLSNVYEERFEKEIQPHLRQLDFIAKNVSIMTVAELERISTALYVKLENSVSSTELAKRIHDLKHHISIEAAERALEELDKLRKKAETKKVITLN
jgi:uncharacterized protein YwgA